MVNKRKTRLMARTAMYEKHEGARSFHRASFFKGDYVGVHMLLSGISATIGFFLVLFLVAVYKFDYIINNLTNINYRQLFSVLILIYVVFLIFYLVVTYFVYAIRYEDDMDGVRMYLSRLKKIAALTKADKKSASQNIGEEEE